jgi:hypothetical protein
VGCGATVNVARIETGLRDDRFRCTVLPLSRIAWDTRHLSYETPQAERGEAKADAHCSHNGQLVAMDSHPLGGLPKVSESVQWG